MCQKKLKIAFVGPIGFADYFGIGGMQSYVRRLGFELARLGHSVDYLIYGAPDESETSAVAGLSIRYYRSFQDVFHRLSSGGYAHVVRVWLSRWDRVKFARYVWIGKGTSRHHYLCFIVPDSRAKRKLGLVEGMIVSRKGRLICVSPRQYEVVRRLSHKAFLLLPPVPDEFFVQPRNKPLRWPVRIAFVGVLHPDKGVKDVARLFLSLKGDPRFECAVYAGHDPANAQQEELHQWFVKQGSVRYVPLDGSRWSVETEREVQRMLREADIFIQPYQSLQNTVDTPLLVLEAMASCCAVLTTPVGSIPELYGRSQFVIDSPDFARRAEDLLKGLSLEDLAAERVRVHQRTEQLRFSARDVALRFVQQIVEAD